jgi:hypothetical protein
LIEEVENGVFAIALDAVGDLAHPDFQPLKITQPGQPKALFQTRSHANCAGTQTTIHLYSFMNETE